MSQQQVVRKIRELLRAENLLAAGQLLESTLSKTNLSANQFLTPCFAGLVHKWSISKRKDAGNYSYDVLERMIAARCMPDTKTFTFTITAYSRRGDAPGCKKVLDLMQSNRIAADIVTHGAVLNCYAQARDPPSAVQYFENLLEQKITPNIFLYNAILHSYSRTSDPASAQVWLKRMEDANIPPTVQAYSTVIDAFSKNDDPIGAQNLLTEMRDRNVSANVVTYNSVLNAFSRLGDVVNSEQIFETMTNLRIEPTIRTYNSLIAACARAQKPTSAVKWFDKLVDANFVPNDLSYNCVIDAHGQALDPQGAITWMQKMENANLKVDVVTASAIINAHREQPHQAFEWFQRFQNEGVRSEVSAYDSFKRRDCFQILVNGLAKTATGDDATVAGEDIAAEEESTIDESIHAHREESYNVENVKSERRAYDILFASFAKFGLLEKSLALLEEMRRNNITPCAYAYANTITACAATPNNHDTAVELMKTMIKEGVETTLICFNTLLSCCAKSGQVNIALEWLSILQKYHPPDLLSYTSCMDACLVKTLQMHEHEICFV